MNLQDYLAHEARMAARKPKPAPVKGLIYKPAIVTAYFVECGLPAPVFELEHYLPGRKFRLDIGWPDHMVGIEVQGAIWVKGAHSTGSGIRRDMEKRNLQLLHGWRVLEVEPKDLCTLETVEMVKRLIPQ
jgi:hypothetical protein